MKNKINSALMDFNDGFFSKVPMVAGIIIIYLVTIFGQSSNELPPNAAIGFTIAIIIQLIVYLFSDAIFKNKYGLYFFVQGIITLGYAIMAPDGFKPIFLGIIPLFVIQSMMIYNDTIKVIITTVFFYSIFFGATIIFSGGRELIKSVPTLIIITIAIREYSAILFKQVKLRIQAQKLLQELELAYEKVEELTLINERQRMARDLHDTLSQGLAGLIMQLEAVNANLNNNNMKRAQEIVKIAMEHSRRTLSDSRMVIYNLRSQIKDEVDLAKIVEKEISYFRNISNIFITENICIKSQITVRLSKHILFIVREALNNIAKHSYAENAFVEIKEDYNQIKIYIKDDGIGFDVKILDMRFGHYGVLGMTERVKAINGKIKIESKRKTGTNIIIIIPIEKGIDQE